MWLRMLRWLGSSEGREGGRIGQKVREVADVGFHGGMPKIFEVVGIHLGEGLVRRPTFKGDTVDGNHDACAIGAEPAMHKDLLARLFADERKEFRDLSIFWRGPSIAADADMIEAERLQMLVLFFNGSRRFAAEVDDRSDAEALEFAKPIVAGLAAAIKEVIDLAGIGNASNLKRLGNTVISGVKSMERGKRTQSECQRYGKEGKGK